jgi:hypothetical protein
VFARSALAIALVSIGAQAHDLYLRLNSFHPRAGETVRVEYHNGDDFPASEAPARIDRLRDMKVLAAAVSFPFTNLRVEGTTTVGDATAPSQEGHFLLISKTVPNFIELEALKFEDYLKHEGLDSIIAWRKQNGESGKPGREIYSKYVKAIGLVGRADDAYGAVAGLAIEFVPLSNPYKASPGTDLPVRVLVRGKPADGLAIEASNLYNGKVTRNVAGRTDADGTVRVRIVHPGLWKLHTVHMERRAERQQADWESLWSSLTFEIPDR